jgi:DNA repair exonuclease SbcCD ATPase subunit
MQLEEIIARLNTIKAQILGWPGNVINENPRVDPDIVFSKIEADLKQLLDQISPMEQPMRERIDSSLQEFKSEISEHYQNTKERLEELKTQLGHGKHHAKAIKAYSKL